MLFEVAPEVLPELQDVGDFVALGGAIGFRAVDRVPLVGCPFLTLEEFVELANLLEGQTVKKRLWRYTDFIEYSAAQKAAPVCFIPAVPV